MTETDTVEVLASLVSSFRPIYHQHFVYRQGSPAKHVYLLMDGWMAGMITSAKSGRQILKVYMPGDLIGMHNVGRISNHDGVYALTAQAIIGEIDPIVLFDAMRCNSKLSQHLSMTAQDERLELMERLTSVGSTSARANIANLMLHFVRRLFPEANEDVPRMYIPMIQHEIGYMTGLTGVHVNRMLRDFRIDGIASWRDQQLAITDLGALRGEAHVDPIPPRDLSLLPVMRAYGADSSIP